MIAAALNAIVVRCERMLEITDSVTYAAAEHNALPPGLRY